LKDCETPETKVVCELSTKTIVTINKDDFDATKYSENLDDCKPPVKITVCELSTKGIVSIDEADFDSKKYSKDLNDCELPHTGPTENIVAFLGLGAMIASVIYYVRSRRFQA
jgi:LPXTG-motif cell wall-anchored protein